MAQTLYLVFGGELIDPTQPEFKDPSALDVIGIFADYDSAKDAWKANAQRTVDNAHMRYFVTELPMAAGDATPDAGPR